jgi:Tfp pilus assembly protein PilF
MSSEQGRRKLRYFYELSPPEKISFVSNRYAVFKVISDNDSVRAQKWTKEGESFLKNGNFDMARRLAKSAVYADPNCYPARLLYAKVFNNAPMIKLRGY